MKVDRFGRILCRVCKRHIATRDDGLCNRCRENNGNTVRLDLFKEKVPSQTHDPKDRGEKKIGNRNWEKKM